MPIDEMRRLRSILKQIPRPRLLLDLGCANLDAVGAYQAVCDGARIIGVDLDGAALRDAARHARAAWLVMASVSHLPFCACFDLIVVRHPDIDRRRADWERLFSTVSHWLDGLGTLLVTTYSVPEIDQVRAWLRANQTLEPLLLAEEMLTPPSLAGRDRYAACYRRYP